MWPGCDTFIYFWWDQELVLLVGYQRYRDFHGETNHSPTPHACDHAGCPSLELINGSVPHTITMSRGGESIRKHQWLGVHYEQKPRIGNQSTLGLINGRVPANSTKLLVPNLWRFLADFPSWPPEQPHQVVVTKVRSAKSWTLSRTTGEIWTSSRHRHTNQIQTLTQPNQIGTNKSNQWEYAIQKRDWI